MKTKVVHLHFKKEPFEDKIDPYFGSMKAIYDSIPQERIGITYKSLTNAIRDREEYENRLVLIHIGELERKPKSKTN